MKPITTAIIFSFVYALGTFLTFAVVLLNCEVYLECSTDSGRHFLEILFITTQVAYWTLLKSLFFSAEIPAAIDPV